MKRILTDQYRPLHFLALLGAGRLSVTFCLCCRFLVTLPCAPMWQRTSCGCLGRRRPDWLRSLLPCVAGGWPSRTTTTACVPDDPFGASDGTVAGARAQSSTVTSASTSPVAPS
jgi:hypothetical protein